MTTSNLSKKASVGKKSLDPFMSNSTSPFRQNLNAGRSTVVVNSNGLGKNKENNCTPKRASVSPFIKGSKSPYKQTMSITQISKLRFENELQIIFREFLRTEQALNDKTLSAQRKLMVDTDKWKKKFKFLLDREKILNFDSVEGSQIFARKGIMTTLEPKVLRKGFGDQILLENTKFWILFTNYNK